MCVCVLLLQSGLTALHLAAQEDKVAVAEILARNGANLDQQTKVWKKGFLPFNNSNSFWCCYSWLKEM